MAHAKLQIVRELYEYRCGYCGITEVDAGGELTIDHFHPVSASGTDTIEKLVYACVRCNLYKSDYWPSVEEVETGHVLLHPKRDDTPRHIRENELTGVLEPLTHTGNFHIDLLDLNRPQLVAHRQRRALQLLSDQIKQSLQEELADLRSELDAYHRYAAQLEKLLGLHLE